MSRPLTSPEKAAPQRFSGREVMQLTGLPLHQIRHEVMRKRRHALTRDEKAFLSSAEAAYFLAHTRFYVTGLVRDGRLPAVKRWNATRDRYSWRIPASAVAALVAQAIG